MRYSDIKAGNIYFVDLDPVRRYEFGGNHLGIVLKKGQDQRTVTIVSLTSNSSGVGKNKSNIGLVSSLPTRLTKKRNNKLLDSYVVLDQVRTVEAGRVQEILDGKESNGEDIKIDCTVDLLILNDINCKLSSLMISNVDNDEVIWTHHKNSFIDISANKIIDLIYIIIKDKDKEDERTEIKYLYNSIIAMKESFSIQNYLSRNDVKNNVSERLIEIVNDKSKMIL